MAISQSYQRFNNNNNIKNWENQQKSGGNFLCVCSNNALIVATKNGELRFNLINGLLSVVGCRLSVLKYVYKDLYHMFDAGKEQKKPKKRAKKRKKCRRTQITLFINQQMLLQTVRREVTHFFPFEIHVRKNAVRTFFRAFFCTQESFWTFFSHLFPMDFFVIFFPSHAKHFSWKILSAETGFSHNCRWTFFWILLKAPLNFISLQRFVSCEFEEKNQPIFKSVNRRAFFIQCGISHERRKKQWFIQIVQMFR